MAKAIVNISDILLSIKDQNTKYLWYKIVDQSRNNFSDASVNYKIKITSSSAVGQYLTSTENKLFGR